MRLLNRSISALTALVLLAGGFALAVPAAAAEHEVAGGAPRADHTYEIGDSFPVRDDPESPHPDESGGHEEAEHDGLVGAAATGNTTDKPYNLTRKGNIKVKLVTVKLADNSGGVNATAAKNAVNFSNNYWNRMSNGRISMTVSSTKFGHVSKARSTWSQTDIMNQVTNELGWKYNPYTALVVFLPAKTLAGGTIGYGWSSKGTSGRVLMPQISGYTSNVIAHEFGHVLGLVHADALQCKAGQPDIASFSGSGCSIKEYGDTLDLMGFGQLDAKAPTISASFWDYGAFGRGDEILDAGVASGSKTFTLRPWSGTAAHRAVKFADPRSQDTYFLEFRTPIGYDSRNAVGGNYGVKITQRGGSTWASSLILMPSTKPFSGYSASNHAWKPGMTFTTHAGTRVKINSMSSSSASVTVSAPLNLLTDMNSDGTSDLLARDRDGMLWLYPGSGGGFKQRIKVGHGWNIFSAILQPGDFNGDGKSDIVARDRTGKLWLYPGTGKGTVRSGVQIGSWDFSDMTTLITPGDFDGDRRADLIARDGAGRLFLLGGNGKGGLAKYTQIGSGWGVFTSVLSTGDFSGDGKPDLLARDSAGKLFLYPGNGSGGFKARTQPGNGWHVFESLMGPGAWSGGDNRTDVIARNGSGQLVLYYGNGKGGFAGSKRIGYGWGTLSVAPFTEIPADPIGDLNEDGTTDVVASDKEGGLWLYPTTPNGGFEPRIQIGSSWETKTATLMPGDFDGDKKVDIISRDSEGNLHLHAGTGRGFIRSGTLIAQGWGELSDLSTPGDFNGDGKVDLLARDAVGKLYLHPGNGAGGFKARTQVGSGWNVMDSIVSTGDFDGDSKSDVLARDVDGRLFLYPGNGSGGFRARTQPGNGWHIFDTITGPGAWGTSDGHADVMAVGSSGELRLYSGNGRGGFGASKVVGWGWGSMTLAE